MPDLHLFTPSEAARMLSLTKRQLFGLPIRRIRLGHRTIRFHALDLQAFLERARASERGV